MLQRNVLHQLLQLRLTLLDKDDTPPPLLGEPPGEPADASDRLPVLPMMPPPAPALRVRIVATVMTMHRTRAAEVPTNCHGRTFTSQSNLLEKQVASCSQRIPNHSSWILRHIITCVGNESTSLSPSQPLHKIASVTYFVQTCSEMLRKRITHQCPSWRVE